MWMSSPPRPARSGAARILALGALLAWCGAPPAGAQEHAAFTRALERHVDARGLVDYDGFAGDADFARYLASLAAVDPAALPRDERLALWINAYNAYTIALINRHRERRSIRNINRTLGLIAGKGPWREPIAQVGGRTYTLDEIEHEIIRPQFGEPRIHFALVCAALGCPALRREAYTGDRLDAQLAEETRRFLLESPRKNRVDVAAGRVHLSPIFRWYAEDFGGSPAALGRYLARFHPPGAQRALLESGRFRIEYTPYDWSLNNRP